MTKKQIIANLKALEKQMTEAIKYKFSCEMEVKRIRYELRSLIKENR